MGKFSYSVRLQTAVAAIALLSSCSGGYSQMGPSGGTDTPQLSIDFRTQRSSDSVFGYARPLARQISRNSPAVRPFVNVAAIDAPGGNQVMVSDEYANTVTIFGGGGQVNAVLGASNGLNNPGGIITDRSATLYVANAAASNILVFAKPYNGQPRVLSDPGQVPLDVSLDEARGLLAVAHYSDVHGGPTSVSFFSRGSKRPCLNIGSPDWSQFGFDAFDKTGNLYIDGFLRPSGAGAIGMITGGCNATSIVTLTTTNTLGFPSGLKVLKNGNIVVADLYAGVIYTYAPPSGNSLGSPLYTMHLRNNTGPLAIAVRAQDRSIWTVNDSDDHKYALQRYRYPTGGLPTQQYVDPNAGLTAGIAVNPAQQL